MVQHVSNYSCEGARTSSLQAAFDVRWCRGPVGEAIIKPWAERLQACGVQIETGQLVQEVQGDELGKPNR